MFVYALIFSIFIFFVEANMGMSFFKPVINCLIYLINNIISP